MTPSAAHWPDIAAIVRFEEGDPDENPWVQGRPVREDIAVASYDPCWAQRYEACAAEIAAALPGVVLGMAHVGSTAVPGLPAKPVIDIDLIVAEPRREEDYVAALKVLGYTLTIREPSWYQHRMLRREHPRVNLHVFGPACAEHVRHLLFRDWLRDHPADRLRYAQAKMLAKEDAANMLEYNRSKQNVVRAIYRDIFASRGWSAGA